MKKRVLVLGGTGHIGTWLVSHLKQEGCYVRVVSRNSPLYKEDAKWKIRTVADEYNICDLRHSPPVRHFEGMEEVFHLAADVGGLGYLQVPQNDAAIMSANTRIDLNVLDACVRAEVPRVLLASSACVYPERWVPPEHKGPILQREEDAYPANPTNEFGWAKLYAERLFAAYARAYPLAVRIARLHQVYGPGAEWRDPRAKVVAALCRKVACLPAAGGPVPIWGDGTQTRSLVHIRDAVGGLVALMRSDLTGPVDLGSGGEAADDAVSVERLARLVGCAAGKPLTLRHEPGPVGSRARVADGALARQTLGWEPRVALADGIAETYRWVEAQVLAEGSCA